jgi:hypothetical protein
MRARGNARYSGAEGNRHPVQASDQKCVHISVRDRRYRTRLQVAVAVAHDLRPHQGQTPLGHGWRDRFMIQ